MDRDRGDKAEESGDTTWAELAVVAVLSVVVAIALWFTWG